MNIHKHWKIILSLTLIFITGAVTGSVITFQVVKRVVSNRTNPDQWSARVLREYRKHLQLTPEQINRIKPRMIEASRNLKAARTEFAQMHRLVFRDIHSDLMEELTPEQREMFKRVREEQMQRYRRSNNGLNGREMNSNQLHGRPQWQQRPQWQREMMKREMVRREREYRSGQQKDENPRRLNSLPEQSAESPNDR